MKQPILFGIALPTINLNPTPIIGTLPTVSISFLTSKVEMLPALALLLPPGHLRFCAKA
jgi:hypothetical protein